MLKLVVEVGMPLDKSLIYYHDMLIRKGLKMQFACVTHDLYYTKEKLDGLTENQMKKACVRLRNLEGVIGKNKDPKADLETIKKQENELIAKGYKKVFDTIKFDFQYYLEGMSSYIQLQDIKDVGLLLYYDNDRYYELSLDEQRKALFDELNSYGFNFKETDMGLDKLRTLYYGKPMYSKNQNG
jgi:hypothetical protein